MGNFKTSILVASLVFCVGSGTAAFACTAPDGQKRQFSAKAGAVVNYALEDINANNHANAILQLQTILDTPKLSPYERSTVYQMLGSALYETEDYQSAVAAFENAVASCGLLPKEASNLRVNIAQLLIANGRPAEGAQRLEDWAADGGKLQPRHIEYLWQAWSQAEQYDRALPWAEKWFDAAKPKRRKHYDLMNFLYRTLHMTNAEALLSAEMVELWPEDRQ